MKCKSEALSDGNRVFNPKLRKVSVLLYYYRWIYVSKWVPRKMLTGSVSCMRHRLGGIATKVTYGSIQ